MRRFVRAGLAAALASAPGTAAFAQAAGEDDLAEPGVSQEAGAWRISIAPYLWLQSIDGNITIANQKGDVDLGFFDDVLPNLEFAGMMIVDAGNGRYGVVANFFGARTTDDSSPIDVTNDVATLGLAGYYRIYEGDFGTTANGTKLGYAIEPLVGARYNYVRAKLKGDVQTPIGEIRINRDESKQWVDPIVGLRTFARLTDRIGLTLEADVGGSRVSSKLAWNAQGYLSYRTSVFGVPTGLAAGYRYYSVDYEDGAFRYNVDTFGPVLGAAFHF